MKYGIDPSDIAQEVVDAIVLQDIFPSKKLVEVLEGKSLDIITSIAMFYDLENPVEFVKGIKQHLSSKGVWLFEMSYMPQMLQLDSFDTICHEHLEYYSLSVIETILKKAGMRLFKISFNDINGGSIRCFATHDTNIAYDNPADIKFLNEVRQTEFDMELDTDKPYKDFWERISRLKTELHDLLVKLKSEGKKFIFMAHPQKGIRSCNGVILIIQS